MKLALTDSTAVGGTTYNEYIATAQRLAKLKEEKAQLEQKASVLKQVVTYLMVSVPAPEQNSTVRQFQQELQYTEHLHTSKVTTQQLTQRHVEIIIISCYYTQSKEIETAKKDLQKACPNDGPFMGSLECSLKALHVERQAYHGATFVGNHVHKLLKVKISHNATQNI